MGGIWAHMENLTNSRSQSDIMQKFVDVYNGRNSDVNAKCKDKEKDSRQYSIAIWKGQGGMFRGSMGAGWFFQ